MSEFKFEIGDVVRHRLVPAVRMLVIRRRVIEESGGEIEYEVRAYEAESKSLTKQRLAECELIADSEPPSGSPVGAVVRPGGDGAREAVPWRNRLATVG